MFKKKTSPLENLLEDTLRHKYTNDFLDRPNLSKYISDNLSSVEFRANLYALAPGVYASQKTMALTQFLKERKIFYLELEGIKKWKDLELPNPQLFGRKAKRWHDYVTRKKFAFSGMLVGGTIALSSMISGIGGVLLGASSAFLTGSSLTWLISNKKKHYDLFAYDGPRKYAQELSKFYSYGLKEIYELKLKKQDPQSHYSKIYSDILSNMIGLVIEDGRDDLRISLNQEKKQVNKLCEHFDKLVKQINKSKKEVIKPSTRGIIESIDTHIYLTDQKKILRLNNYLNDINCILRQENPGFTEVQEYELDGGEDEPKRKGYDGWLDSEDFKFE